MSFARQLYGGASGNLLLEGLCHMLCDPGLLQPAPQSPRQATADPGLPRRHSNTQRQVWLSLCGVPESWRTQGFVSALQESLAGMGFDSKCDYAPPISIVLLGLLFCPWMWGVFFLVGSNILLLVVVQQGVAILWFSQEKISACAEDNAL